MGKDRISAKNGLESYCFNMKSTFDDDRETINDKCDETIKWLDANQTAEQDEYADKQKEIEGVCNPIITKLYQACPVLLPEPAPDPDPPSRRSTKHFRSQPSTHTSSHFFYDENRIP